jgi:hypothetical protein
MKFSEKVIGKSNRRCSMVFGAIGLALAAAATLAPVEAEANGGFRCARSFGLRNSNGETVHNQVTIQLEGRRLRKTAERVEELIKQVKAYMEEQYGSQLEEFAAGQYPSMTCVKI